MSTVRRVFITVKTYPTLSKKYDELVCTAGILDDGSWVRIYPLPFRKLDFENRYKKYQWIELPLVKNESDPRPESYKITDISKVQLIGDPVGTKQGWAERKQIIFGKNDIHSYLATLITKANNNELSIAIFKPAELLEFVVEKTEREWDQDSLENLKTKANQFSLFQTEDEVRKEFLIVDKLPYKFSYRFKDCVGKESTLMIEHWEIGALFWNCLKQSEGNEDEAINLVRKKYFAEFSSKEIFSFSGYHPTISWMGKKPFCYYWGVLPTCVSTGFFVLGQPLWHPLMNNRLKFSVFEIVGSQLCVASSDGQRIYERIAATLNEKRCVTLSFHSITTLTAVFLNTAIGQLYGILNEEQIRTFLKVQDMQPEDMVLLKRVVETSKQYFKDQQR